MLVGMADGDCGGAFGLRCMSVGVLGGTTAEDHDGTMAENWDGRTAENQDGMMVEDHDGTVAESLDGTMAEDHGGMMAENLVGKMAEEVDNPDHMVFASEKVDAVQMLLGLGEMSLMCSLRGNRLARTNC